MLDDATFRRNAEAAIRVQKQFLMQAETEASLEVEERQGTLVITLDRPPSKFELTPNSAMRQIWLSTGTNSLHLDWDETRESFALATTGEPLKLLLLRLINERLDGNQITSA